MARGQVLPLPASLQEALLELKDEYENTGRHSSGARRGLSHSDAALKLGALALVSKERGWTWRQMGEVLELSGERVRQLAVAARGNENLVDGTQFPSLADVKVSLFGEPKRPQNRILSDEEVDELRSLAELASQTTGGVPIGDPRREASIKCSQLIIKYKKQGVTWKDLADATGLSMSGVRARATRHGYTDAVPPTMVPYMNKTVQREPSPVCSKGHKMTAENTYTYITPQGAKQRTCRTCRADWSRDRAARAAKNKKGQSVA